MYITYDSAVFNILRLARKNYQTDQEFNQEKLSYSTVSALNQLNEMIFNYEKISKTYQTGQQLDQQKTSSPNT